MSGLGDYPIPHCRAARYDAGMSENLSHGSLRRIVSGGQTGVDRGALDAAIRLGIPYGGWCPRGRLAEDGPIPAKYQLVETDAPDYAMRTEQNVRDSDATLILCRGALGGGSELTRRLAESYGKPCLVVDLETSPSEREAIDWLRENQVGMLNVAGPRESSYPGIAAQAERFIERVLASQ